MSEFLPINTWYKNKNIASISLKKTSALPNMSNSKSEFDFNQATNTHKLAIVVRSDLCMSAGKVSSQCVHAAMGALRAASPENVSGWFDSCEVTIVLSSTCREQFDAVYKTATEKSVPVYVWIDAGRTEVPSNSATVMAIGPAPYHDVDSVCVGLRLYK
jgi:PTH2 family peptidyl-tRNA hydrolase